MHLTSSSVPPTPISRPARSSFWRAIAAPLLAAALAASCSLPDFQFASPNSGAACDSGSDCDAGGSATEPCLGGCQNEHGATRCLSGQCRPVCAAGFADCNGNPNDGCEADLGRPENCGACAAKCSSNGGAATCVGEVCGIDCEAGHADCINGLADGCETDLMLNVRHCGSCENACPQAGGTPSCVEGKCGVSACVSPLSDCNADSSKPGGDGCETDTSKDPLNCGDCGVQCYFANASAKCVGKVCAQDACSTGYADCTVASGCETKLGTLSDCLACGDACKNEHGTSSCGALGCTASCARDWGDCDDNPNNGCETPLTTLSDCGACGTVCAFTHATASCATGACTQGGCDPGFADCSSVPGCETQNSCQSTGGGGSGGATGNASVCAQSGFAFCDDFEDGNANGWVPNGGTWSVLRDDSFVYQGGSGNFQSSTGSTSWTDVTLEARMKVIAFGGSSASYRAGLLVRYNGASSAYLLAIDATGNLVLLRGSSSISGASGSCSAIAAGVTIGTWHTLRLTVSGPSGNVSLKSYLDGVIQHDCLTTVSTSANGEIALTTVGSNTRASFDNVRVTIP
jgi:hypothetical protein